MATVTWTLNITVRTLSTLREPAPLLQAQALITGIPLINSMPMEACTEVATFLFHLTSPMGEPFLKLMFVYGLIRRLFLVEALPPSTPLPTILLHLPGYSTLILPIHSHPRRLAMLK